MTSLLNKGHQQLAFLPRKVFRRKEETLRFGVKLNFDKKNVSIFLPS